MGLGTGLGRDSWRRGWGGAPREGQWPQWLVFWTIPSNFLLDLIERVQFPSIALLLRVWLAVSCSGGAGSLWCGLRCPFSPSLASLCWSQLLATDPTPCQPRADTRVLGGMPRLTPMDYQLRFTQHLATSVAGHACVDTGIVLAHAPQHQGVGGPFLLLAEPGTIHQLGIVLGAREGGAAISPPWGPLQGSLSRPEVSALFWGGNAATHSPARPPHTVPVPTRYQVTMGCGLPSMTAWNWAVLPLCACTSSMVTCMDGGPGVREGACEGGPGCASCPAHRSPSSMESSSWGWQSGTPSGTSIDPGPVLTPPRGSQALRYSPGVQSPPASPNEDDSLLTLPRPLMARKCFLPSTLCLSCLHLCCPPLLGQEALNIQFITVSTPMGEI